jgi:hypothetical protein
MAKFVEYEADRGLATYEDMNDGHLQVHYRQDVEPVLEYTKKIRNDGLADLGIKRDMWHYAHVPPVVILKWRFEHGVDIFNKDHMPKVLQLLNTEYKALKTTDKTHTVRN